MEGEGQSPAKLLVILGITAVLFAGGLIPLERIPEIPVDIDQKPFFIPYALAAVLPYGGATLAIGFGAATGEGFLDVLEGYEMDDPFGFLGYIVAFTIFGYIFHKWGGRNSIWIQSVACVLAGFVQSAFEATALLVIEGEAIRAALISCLGNTLTHGVIGGLIPFLILYPLLSGRIERFLGFAPAEKQATSTTG